MPEIRLLKTVTSAIEHAKVLDPAIGFDLRLVRALAKPASLRRLLHGVPVGHPLHPLIVQVPLGAWLSAALLDTLPGEQRAARTLVGVGVLAAGAATTTGFVDWSELSIEQQRTGWVHAMVNFTALSLYGFSWWERRNGNVARGKVLGFLGLGVVSAGGYLGGHLAYRQRGGVSEHGEVPFDR
jgi:uncharacterized membrane protein